MPTDNQSSRCFATATGLLWSDSPAEMATSRIWSRRGFIPSRAGANDYFDVPSPSTAGPAIGTIAAAPVVTAAPAIATITAIARVAAITTAPAIGVVVTAPTVVAAIISGVTLRAIATITPISLNGARQSPHYQHCEKSAQHDTSPASCVRIVCILVPTRESSKPSIGSW
jgi:hypothetical protein